MRYFRVPMLPLMARVLPFNVFADKRPWEMDRWILQHFPAAQKYATNVTMRLRKAS
jgi:hypothetical protein